MTSILPPEFISRELFDAKSSVINVDVDGDFSEDDVGNEVSLLTAQSSTRSPQSFQFKSRTDRIHNHVRELEEAPTKTKKKRKTKKSESSNMAIYVLAFFFALTLVLVVVFSYLFFANASENVLDNINEELLHTSESYISNFPSSAVDSPAQFYPTLFSPTISLSSLIPAMFYIQSNRISARNDVLSNTPILGTVDDDHRPLFTATTSRSPHDPQTSQNSFSGKSQFHPVTQYTLILFFANWCGHCIKKAPLFERLGHTFNEDPLSPVKVLKVDCAQSGLSLCSAMDIKGYPSAYLASNEVWDEVFGSVIVDYSSIHQSLRSSSQSYSQILASLASARGKENYVVQTNGRLSPEMASRLWSVSLGSDINSSVREILKHIHSDVLQANTQVPLLKTLYDSKAPSLVMTKHGSDVPLLVMDETQLKSYVASRKPHPHTPVVYPHVTLDDDAYIKVISKSDSDNKGTLPDGGAQQKPSVSARRDVYKYFASALQQSLSLSAMGMKEISQHYYTLITRAAGLGKEEVSRKLVKKKKQKLEKSPIFQNLQHNFQYQKGDVWNQLIPASGQVGIDLKNTLGATDKDTNNGLMTIREFVGILRQHYSMPRFRSKLFETIFKRKKILDQKQRALKYILHYTRYEGTDNVSAADLVDLDDSEDDIDNPIDKSIVGKREKEPLKYVKPRLLSQQSHEAFFSSVTPFETVSSLLYLTCTISNDVHLRHTACQLFVSLPAFIPPPPLGHIFDVISPTSVSIVHYLRQRLPLANGVEEGDINDVIDVMYPSKLLKSINVDVIEDIVKEHQLRAKHHDLSSNIYLPPLSFSSLEEVTGYVDALLLNNIPLAKYSPLPYANCAGSTPNSSRGFTCGMWTYIHHLTSTLSANDVVDIYNKNHLFKETMASRLMLGLRLHISHFFGCVECRNHILRYSTNIDELIHMQSLPFIDILDTHDPFLMTQKDIENSAVLHLPSSQLMMWWWDIHNNVNKRLAKDEGLLTKAGDPLFPKQNFPQYSDCPDCFDTSCENDACRWKKDWNLTNIFMYLNKYYSLK